MLEYENYCMKKYATSNIAVCRDVYNYDKKLKCAQTKDDNALGRYCSLTISGGFYTGPTNCVGNMVWNHEKFLGPSC